MSMDFDVSSGLAAESSTSTYVYPTAILIAVFAFVLCVLTAPPMVWHARNRNIGATSLIFWILILNFQTFLNALIWRTDSIKNWFDGNVLCDIEVKIQIASEIGFPSSAACVLRALANVMNTEKVTLTKTTAQRRRAYAIDILWCAGFPLLQMLFHYIVQARRYYVFGISGCVPAIDYSWVTDLLIITPPVLWTAVCAFYACKSLTPVTSSSTPTDKASPRPRPYSPTPLPPHLHHPARPQQHQQIAFPAPLHALHGLACRLNPARRLRHRPADQNSSPTFRLELHPQRHQMG